MATGTVKKVIADRGFGFITAEDEKDYFFHRDALDSSLDFDRLIGGERVEFEIEASPKGPRAAKVHAAYHRSGLASTTGPARRIDHSQLIDHRHALWGSCGGLFVPRELLLRSIRARRV